MTRYFLEFNGASRLLFAVEDLAKAMKEQQAIHVSALNAANIPFQDLVHGVSVNIEHLTAPQLEVLRGLDNTIVNDAVEKLNLIEVKDKAPFPFSLNDSTDDYKYVKIDAWQFRRQKPYSQSLEYDVELLDRRLAEFETGNK